MQPSPTAVMRQRSRFVRFTCQICDKVFATQDTLNQHIATHRTPQKPSVLSFRLVLFSETIKHLYILEFCTQGQIYILLPMGVVVLVTQDTKLLEW